MVNSRFTATSIGACRKNAWHTGITVCVVVHNSVKSLNATALNIYSDEFLTSQISYHTDSYIRKIDFWLSG